MELDLDAIYKAAYAGGPERDPETDVRLLLNEVLRLREQVDQLTDEGASLFEALQETGAMHSEAVGAGEALMVDYNNLAGERNAVLYYCRAVLQRTPEPANEYTRGRVDALRYVLEILGEQA